MMRLGLALASEWLGAPLPAEARRRIRLDAAIAPLSATAIGAIEAADRPFRAAWKSAFHVRSRDGVADGLRYRLRRALDLNADDWTAVALPERLHALYYPLRLLRILGAQKPR